MEAQKIVIKIARQKLELIPFDLEKWNTEEYEAVEKDYGTVRILCIDNKGEYPIVICTEDGKVGAYISDGRYVKSEANSRLFLRKKSSEELPKDLFANVYNNDIGNRYNTLDETHESSINDRLAIIHITYEWED